MERQFKGKYHILKGSYCYVVLESNLTSHSTHNIWIFLNKKRHLCFSPAVSYSWAMIKNYKPKSTLFGHDIYNLWQLIDAPRRGWLYFTPMNLPPGENYSCRIWCLLENLHEAIRVLQGGNL